MSQLAFDLNIVVEPLYFSDLMTADRCRDCRRPVAGRHTRCAQGCNEHGFWVMCDDCALGREVAA